MPRKIESKLSITSHSGFRLLLCIILTCAAAFASSNQKRPYTIQGTVVADKGYEPLPGVNVLIVGTTLGASTDASGNFSIPQISLSAGSYELAFKFVGYETKSYQVQLGTSQTVDVGRITLTQAALAVEEVVVVAEPGSRQAMRVGVLPQFKSLPINSNNQVKVILLDSDNQVVSAPKNLQITVEAFLPSGEILFREAVIKKGDSLAKVNFNFRESGLIEVRAKQPELLDGGTFIKVKPSNPRNRGMRDVGFLFNEVARVIPAAFTGVFSETSYLMLLCSQREYRATGKDPAIIEAWLMGEDSTSTDIKVLLSNTGGTLLPNPIIIRAGEDHGESRLTSRQVGPVDVELVGSKPFKEIKEPKIVSVKFRAPVTRIKVDASPKEISLLEGSEIAVIFLDDEGLPVETDAARDVSFSIDVGRGKLSSSQITIEEGKYRGVVRFTPTWIGEVSVKVSTPKILSETVQLHVTTPILEAILSGAGGLISGALAGWKSKRKLWRILIGLICGFLFCWALIFGVLTFVPRDVALNPVSVLALSMLGGWIGTGVFNLILGRFGVRGKEETQESPSEK